MKIRPFGDKWRADAGTIIGRRVTRVFEKKADAERWLKVQERIRNDTRLGIRRITSTREQIAALAFEQLDGAGLSQESLLDAVRRFVAIASPGKATPLSDAMVAFERDLNFGNRSPVYISQIGRQLNRFLRDFSEKQLHEITSADVLKWLTDNCESASNRANRRRELKVFFSWAVKQSLMSENPVERIPRISVDLGRPDILSVPQVRSALQNLAGQDRVLFAIMVFTGLRPSEAEALHLDDIKLDRGFLEAKRGFRADNRNVRLSSNLVAWLNLEHFKDWGTAVGVKKIFTGSTRRWRDRVRRAIAAEAEPLPVWPQDILRHTFGSYHLEAFKNAAETAHEMGHRGNPRMLYAHYRELVTPEDAKAFWEIKACSRSISASFS